LAGACRWRGAILFLLLVAGAVSAPSPVSAQDLEPRAYANLPIGLNFVLGGYGYAQGGLKTDPNLPITNADLRVHTAVGAYVRSFGVLGMSARFDAIVAHSWLSGHAKVNGQRQQRQVAGFNDPKLRVTLNFYGAPALSMKEFANYKQDLIIGASVQVSLPLGQYDSSRLVNIGTNRWSVKPELGISKAWGPLTLEIAPSVTFYTKNNDFFNGNTREQDPVYAVQGHVVYSFSRGIWASVDSTYFFGGRTAVNGINNDDRLETWRLGATLSIPIARHHSIKLFGSTGVSTRTGNDFDAVGIVWQYRWGPGL
jgi:hypothetical protein